MNTYTSSEMHYNKINRKKLFKGICLSLLPTAFSFVLVSNILDQLKTEFVLTNGQVGFIGGAALWGMAISLVLVGPFLEKLGLKIAARSAFICQLSGVTLFLASYPFAGEPIGYWILFLGAIGFGVGNGFVEVFGNPLTAALFPDEKTTKLNHFHAFFPTGMAIGGLLGWLMIQVGVVGSINIGHWTFQIALIYIPIFIYGLILLPERFPQTETAQAGIPVRELFRYTLSQPKVWGLILLFMFTLPLAMGPYRWIPSVLQASGVPGMLVFVWMSVIMMTLRFSAGAFVKKLAPTRMLGIGALLAGTGLLLFYFFDTGWIRLMIAATVFECGVAFFIPTCCGLMSERFPRAGSLGIVLLMGLGNFAGGGSQAVMGNIADHYLPQALDKEKTVAILQKIEASFPAYLAKAEQASHDPQTALKLGYRTVDIGNVIDRTDKALVHYRANGDLNGKLTGNALRALMDTKLKEEKALITEAANVLRPADNYGGRMAFLWLVPVAFSVAIVFLIWYYKDRRQGGYKTERLEKNGDPEANKQTNLAGASEEIKI